MAAGEDEPQPVVDDHLVLLQRALGTGRHLDVVADELGEPGPHAGLPAYAVDGPPARGRGQPGPRPVGSAALAPRLERGDERLLGALLGRGDVTAEQARHGGEDEAPLGAVRLLDGGSDVGALRHPVGRQERQPVGWIGRTSTLDPGRVRANPSAWSRSVQSRT